MTESESTEQVSNGALQVPNLAGSDVGGGVNFVVTFNGVQYNVSGWAPDSHQQYGFSVVKDNEAVAALVYKDDANWRIKVDLPASFKVDDHLTLDSMSFDIAKGQTKPRLTRPRLENASVTGQNAVEPQPGFDIVINLDTPSVGLELTGSDSSLATLLRSVPAPIDSMLSWLPDVRLDEVTSALNLKSGAIAAYAKVSDGSATALQLVLFVLPSAGQTPDAVAQLWIDRTITLEHAPLFGSLLSQTGLAGVKLSFSTREIATADLDPPPDAPALDSSFPAGAALEAVLLAGGTRQTLPLTSATAGENADGFRAFPAPDIARADGGVALTSAAVWFNLNKTFGPLTIRRVALLAQNGRLGLGLDAALDVGFLSVSLMGFSVEVPIGAAAGAPAVSLDGLAIAAALGPLRIAGSLARSVISGQNQYDRSALLRIAELGITVAGSYGVVDGHPSLFLFGAVQGPFGGPPAFFVTGFAAGFGLNRRLRLPAPTQVKDFPLIAAAESGGPNSATQALAALSSQGWVPPAVGETWIAAGLTFTSFELLRGNALLTVQIGRSSSSRCWGWRRCSYRQPPTVTCASLRRGRDRGGRLSLHRRCRSRGRPDAGLLCSRSLVSADGRLRRLLLVRPKSARGRLRGEHRRVSPAVPASGVVPQLCPGSVSPGSSLMSCSSRERRTSR